MTNFIWQLIQGREFITNCHFYLFLLPLFHPFNLGRSQSTSTLVHQRTYTMAKYFTILVYVYKEKLLPIQGRKLKSPTDNSGKRIHDQGYNQIYLSSNVLKGIYNFPPFFLFSILPHYFFPVFPFDFSSLFLIFLFLSPPPKGGER